MKQLAEKHNISGIHGPLIELFECPDQFMTAVEVTAGNRLPKYHLLFDIQSLFHIVVDTDETAAKLLELLNKEKESGRVTFMPLNQLNPKPVDLPESPDVLPMLNELKFKPMFKKAFQQVSSRQSPHWTPRYSGEPSFAEVSRLQLPSLASTTSTASRWMGIKSIREEFLLVAITMFDNPDWKQWKEYEPGKAN